MFREIANFLKDFLDASPRDANVPYASVSPSAPPAENAEEPKNSQSYQETNADVESIAGFSLNFGTTDEMAVDATGNVRHIKRKVGHIVGTGILVTHIEPTIKDGINLPGIGGICGNCTTEMLEAGLDIQEVERRSLFDSNSGAQCDSCGRKNLCIRHCRPFDDGSGKIFNLCPECIKAAKREKYFAAVVKLLTGPITETKKLLPAQERDK